MDVSKLPRLSKKNAADDPSAPQAAPGEAPIASAAPLPRVENRALLPAAPGIGADIWFNIIVGLLLLYLGKTFARYLYSRLAGQPFDSGIVFIGGDQDGQPVPYSQVANFQMLTDAGMFLFGLVVLLEAAIKAIFGMGFRLPKIIFALTLFLAAFCTIFNLYTAVKVMGSGIAPLFSGLAVAFGGYIITDILRLYKIQSAMDQPIVP